MTVGGDQRVRPARVGLSLQAPSSAVVRTLILGTVRR